MSKELKLAYRTISYYVRASEDDPGATRAAKVEAIARTLRLSASEVLAMLQLPEEE